MTWYNPISWFGNKDCQAERLICDSPACAQEIRQRYVSYDRRKDKVYHDDDCAKIGRAFIFLESNEHIHEAPEHISRKRVVNIRKSLEKKLIEEVYP